MHKLKLTISIPLENGQTLEHIFSDEVVPSKVDAKTVGKFIDWSAPLIKFWVEHNLEKRKYASTEESENYIERAYEIYRLCIGSGMGVSMLPIAQELARIDGKIIKDLT